MGRGGLESVVLTQSNPVDCCLCCCCLLYAKGLYRDVANNIVDGACGPLLIHADKSKSKEKEAEERVRQCNGAAPTETNASL